MLLRALFMIHIIQILNQYLFTNIVLFSILYQSLLLDEKISVKIYANKTSISGKSTILQLITCFILYLNYCNMKTRFYPSITIWKMIYYKVIRKPPLSSVRVADSIVVVLEKIRKKKCRVQSPTYTHKRKKKAQTAIIQNYQINNN